jgi:hypothetical protein
MAILHPVREVKLTARAATVHELNWKEQREFSQRLTAQIDAMLKAKPGDASGARMLSVETLVGGIKDSMELSEWLVAKSSDLKPAEVDALSITEFFTVLDVALDLRRRKPGGREHTADSIGSAIDFLVWQGHSRPDTDNMTIRQIEYYVDKATARLRSMHSEPGGRGKTGNPYA